MATPTAALAEVQSPAVLPSRSDLDQAAQTGRARSGEVFQRLEGIATTGRPAHGRQIPALTVAPGRAPDPGAIAEQFRQTQADTAPRGPALLVFVSFSMPAESLLRLAQQVKQADGVLVLRGLAGASLREMVARVQPLAKTGAAIQISPEAFTRFGVAVVPTFALANSAAPCGDSVCEALVQRVAGDVTLEHALERLAHPDNPIGQAAAVRLNLLRGGR
jgi:conjugal transfer pilus assembly protein TrbC